MFLSIIIPVYNTSKIFLDECLESLNHIPSIPHEIIIVNDGSKEVETLNYLKSIEKKYQLIHKENGGLGSARNTGIKEAKGKYIFPLDSDDVLNEDFKIFIEYLNKNEQVDILYGDLHHFGDEDLIKKYPEYDKLTLLFYKNIIQACSFFKKEAWEKVGGYDESLKTFEDYDFWIKCGINDLKFKHIPYCAYRYRFIDNGKSLFQRTSGIHEEYFKLIRNKIPKGLIKVFDIHNYSKHNVKEYFENKKREKKGIKGKLIYIKSIFRIIKRLVKIRYFSLGRIRI
ncbi:glycosyltransferase family 2 protein [Tenacibaculum sp. TC6]|uniref:glycosyltransferase family 2 protein n=1 Tax=Tenacibaculum sp. TC6 TaxID=3423223 RepID=UPI003D35FCA2